MKTLIPLCLLLLALNPFASAQTDGDRLFDSNYLHEIRFESADPSFFTMLENAFNDSQPEHSPYLGTAVRIDGQVLDSVGVRIKGGSSAYNLKRPLKIDFNAFMPGQAYDGIKKLNLQNADIDPSVQRDAIAYYLFRQAGVHAPRTAFARVYVNDVYHGVYILVEQVDKNFLREHFASDEGTLYKNKICSIEVEAGEQNLAHYTEMISIATSLSGPAFQTAIEKVLDTDAFLRYFLVSNFINATDNAIDVDCNYYLYHQPKSGLLYWIPWDFNYALHAGVNYPLVFLNSANQVFDKMMDTPVYRERYLQLACTLLDYLLNETHVNPVIAQNAQLIRDAVAVDPRFPYTIAAFDQQQDFLKNLMLNRRQQFENDLNTLAVACSDLASPVPPGGIVLNEFVASADSIGGNPDPAGGYPDWIELYNHSADTVLLDGVYLSDDEDFEKKWPFPKGTRIPPSGYLIVWADQDIDEPGLHANFKISKEGGYLALVFEDRMLIDSVRYGPQTTNLAAARVPNGSGPLVQQAATFGQNNGPLTQIRPEPAGQLELELFPNPASGVLYVRIAAPAGQTPVTVRLLNALGQTLRQQQTNRLDLSGLPAGLYTVVVEAGPLRGARKVVVSGN
ncbi:MAG: CotH kinase family protein [Saprospiraceae bacterium]|nr:CotH kinase family protein [Saprospiraceae bacterium]